MKDQSDLSHYPVPCTLDHTKWLGVVYSFGFLYWGSYLKDKVCPLDKDGNPYSFAAWKETRENMAKRR